LDGWLGELGRKNLLLLAPSLAQLAELRELGELGDLGDWKPKFFSPLFQRAKNKKDFFIFFIFFELLQRVRADVREEWSE
jgi:hypothetical protein